MQRCTWPNYKFGKPLFITAFKKTASVSSQDELNADRYPHKKEGSPDRQVVEGYHKNVNMVEFTRYDK